MLLGKRPRPPVMRRTRSMSGGMAVDTQATEATNLEEAHHEELMMSDSLQPHHHQDQDGIKDPHAAVLGTHHIGLLPDHTKSVHGAEHDDERLVTTVMFPSPTITVANNHSQNQTSNPAPVMHTPHFLRTCGLCKCPLAPGRDIYMYRGDTAFCSLECREQQMKQDQRKNKWKVASIKEDHCVSSPTPTAKASTKSQTAACT